MVDLDALHRFALDHQRDLLNDAARRRLINRSGSRAHRAPTKPFRARIAAGLRRAADRIEPVTSPSY